MFILYLCVVQIIMNVICPYWPYALSGPGRRGTNVLIEQ